MFILASRRNCGKTLYERKKNYIVQFLILHHTSKLGCRHKSCSNMSNLFSPRKKRSPSVSVIAENWLLLDWAHIWQNCKILHAQIKLPVSHFADNRGILLEAVHDCGLFQKAEVILWKLYTASCILHLSFYYSYLKILTYGFVYQCFHTRFAQLSLRIHTFFHMNTIRKNM